MVQGFACGWIYIFGFMVDFANKAVTFSHYMSYWIEENTRNNVLEITSFFLVPILVNVLNVRKYGEVEHWLTAFKLFSILGIILVAFVIAAGGAPSPTHMKTSRGRRVGGRRVAQSAVESSRSVLVPALSRGLSVETTMPVPSHLRSTA